MLVFTRYRKVLQIEPNYIFTDLFKDTAEASAGHFGLLMWVVLLFRKHESMFSKC